MKYISPLTEFYDQVADVIACWEDPFDDYDIRDARDQIFAEWMGWA